MENVMKNNIEISLIVATANRDVNITKLLDSLKDSGILKRKDIEVIVVSNNREVQKISKVEEICDMYGVVLLHEKIPGKSYAVNRGIYSARGKYIAFTDDDVIIKDANWLDIMVGKFKKYPKLGYVSGNVIALNQDSEAEIIWERKGGLSKGLKEKYWSRSFLGQLRYRIFPWLFKDICAGANSMIPRKVLEEIGFYNVLLENLVIVGGGTLEIGYRIAKSGYELLYTPESQVFHKHPKTIEELKRKMKNYGIFDTAHPMCIFIEHRDFRYLWWAVFGHSTYTVKKLINRVFGRYPFPSTYILKNLEGNILGWLYFIHYYYFKGGRKSKIEYFKNINYKV